MLENKRILTCSTQTHVLFGCHSRVTLACTYNTSSATASACMHIHTCVCLCWYLYVVLTFYHMSSVGYNPMHGVKPWIISSLPERHTSGTHNSQLWNLKKLPPASRVEVEVLHMLENKRHHDSLPHRQGMLRRAAHKQTRLYVYDELSTSSATQSHTHTQRRLQALVCINIRVYVSVDTYVLRPDILSYDRSTT